MKAYCDTSFAIKLYVEESQCATADKIIHRFKDSIPLTGYLELEMMNAFQLRLFRNQTSETEINKSKDDFVNDIIKRRWITVQVDVNALIPVSLDLTEKHSAQIGCRLLDILHVASALALEVDTLLSFDVRQRQLAEIAGLKLLPKNL